MTYYLSTFLSWLLSFRNVINMFVRHSTLSANRGSWTKGLFLFANVNTELKYYIFRAPAISLPFGITNPSLPHRLYAMIDHRTCDWSQALMCDSCTRPQKSGRRWQRMFFCCWHRSYRFKPFGDVPIELSMLMRSIARCAFVTDDYLNAALPTIVCRNARIA